MIKIGVREIGSQKSLFNWSVKYTFYSLTLNFLFNMIEIDLLKI